MFSLFTKKKASPSATSKTSKLAGSAFIILNTIRAMNIITLLSVAIASWIMLIMTVKTSNFYFFDGVSHFISSAISLFLIITELPIFQKYIRTWWPAFGPEAGFTALGAAMVVLGFNVLGNLNKSATSVQNLGLPEWREVIAAGVLSTVMGFANIVSSFIFKNRALGLSARSMRQFGADPPPTTHKTEMYSSASSYRSHSGSIRRSPCPEPLVLPSYHATSPPSNRRSRFGMKFPIRLSAIGKPMPSDANKHASEFGDSGYGNGEGNGEVLEDRRSPIAPEVQRPPTALHPIYGGGGNSHRAYSPSRYSVTTSGENRI